MKARILLLDDARRSLASSRDALALRHDNWEFDLVTDPGEAYAKVAAWAPAVVVANFRLKGETNGLQALQQIEALRPETQRFIVASEHERFEIAPWLGGACLYLPKPCPAERLESEIIRCLAIERWLDNPRIKQLVALVDTFPTLPTVYLQIVDTLRSPDASAADVAQAISGDVAIVAKLLQIANSAYYGFDEKVTDIKQAVSFIGMRSVKNLVLAMKVFGDIGKSDEQREQISQLLGHSIGVAISAQRIALLETGDEAAGEEAYTAGLLHDIGRLLLITAAPRQFKNARALARESRITEFEAENQIVGCNHAELGAYLLGRWGMPAAIVDATARHHAPADSADRFFSPLAAVHVANALEWERVPARAGRPEARCDETYLSAIGRLAKLELWREATLLSASEFSARVAAAAQRNGAGLTNSGEQPRGFIASALSSIFGRSWR